jgi:hypothetical protein
MPQPTPSIKLLKLGARLRISVRRFFLPSLQANQDEFEATYLALKRVELRLNQIGLNPLRMRFARGRTRASRSTTFVNAVCVHLAHRFLQPDARSAWRLSSLLASKTYTIADVWRCIDLPAGACY